jgi:hypothetical protein
LAIVTQVNADGTIETVSGDWDGASGSEATFAGSSHVVANGPAYSSAVNSFSQVMGMYIIGYAIPAGVTHPVPAPPPAVPADNTLAFIKTSNTTNGQVEVHLASATSGYQTRTLQTATTFANESDGVWQLLPNEDLAFIKTSNTANGHVEVHIASRASGYQTRTLQTATTFANETDGVWEIVVS